MSSAIVHATVPVQYNLQYNRATTRNNRTGTPHTPTTNDPKRVYPPPVLVACTASVECRTGSRLAKGRGVIVCERECDGGRLLNRAPKPRLLGPSDSGPWRSYSVTRRVSSLRPLLACALHIARGQRTRYSYRNFLTRSGWTVASASVPRRGRWRTNRCFFLLFPSSKPPAPGTRPELRVQTYCRLKIQG